VSPDLDSVTYWLGDVFDRERGWGRRDETFRATEELRSFDPEQAWFNLGDLDIATHLYRTNLLAAGETLTSATAAVARRFGVVPRIIPMSDDPVTTRISVVADGEEHELHFQDYWVRRGGRDEVKAVRYEGAERSRPAPGVLEALADADAIVLCPSNPVASLGPILAVPGIREAVGARGTDVVGVSGIVAGAPLAGMADRLMPAAGAEVTAAGAAECYRGLLGAWVVDDADRALIPRIESTGLRVGATDSIMTDDAKAEALARFALGLLG